MKKGIFKIALIAFFVMGFCTFASSQTLISGYYGNGLSLAYNPASKQISGYFENYTGLDNNGEPVFSCISKGFLSTGSLETDPCLSTVFLFFRLYTGFPRGFHSVRGKPHRLLLMLVVISLTRSAKAGSVCICCSTFCSEWRMVVWSRLLNSLPMSFMGRAFIRRIR